MRTRLVNEVGYWLIGYWLLVTEVGYWLWVSWLLVNWVLVIGSWSKILVIGKIGYWLIGYWLWGWLLVIDKGYIYIYMVRFRPD